jgi:signal transduction histidine kinase
MTLKRTLTDALLTLAVGVFTVFGTRGAAENADPTRRDLDPLAYVLVVIAAAGVIVWRRWPLATLAVSAGAGVVYLAREYPYGPVIAVMAFTMFNAAVRLPVRRSLPACGLAIAGLLAGGLIHVRDYTGALQLLASSAWFLVPWAIGTVVQGRREASARDREESRRRTAYEQRLSIARDVHDVVGHGLAVINMQAGIALHVLEKRPEQAAVALDAIKRTSKEALDELRTTLAVYRSTDPAPRSPAAGLGQLDALVASTGLDVSLKVTGEPCDVPTSVDLAAYRIVQESLTNVLRHAGEATVTVHIGHEPGALLVEVIDTGSGSPAHQPGHGIAGMRERAAAVGGTLEAGPRAEGGFAVRARLPVGE